VLAGDVADEEEAEAGSLDTLHGAAGNSVEAAKDSLILVGGEANARISDSQSGPCVVGDGEGAAHMDAIGRIFDGVVEEVEDGGAKVLGDPHDAEADGAWDRLENDGVG